MLIKLMDIQQKKLEELAQQRIALNDKLYREQHHISQLQGYQKDLASGVGGVQILNMQNQQSMKTQIQNLIDSQQQQLALTEADLTRQNSLIRQQIGQLKGIETVAQRRQAKAELERELLEQFQNDELATQTFLRDRSL